MSDRDPLQLARLPFDLTALIPQDLPGWGQDGGRTCFLLPSAVLQERVHSGPARIFPSLWTQRRPMEPTQASASFSVWFSLSRIGLFDPLLFEI